MDGAAGAPGPASVRRRPGLSKAQKIGTGLLLTLSGLFLLWGIFPTSPQDDAGFLPYAAAGIVALWVGGLLMGVGSRS